MSKKRSEPGDSTGAPFAEGPSWKRPPAVAGRFYPEAEAPLRKLLADYLPKPAASPLRTIAVFAPHAGFIYSGRIAGALYQQIEIPDRVILLCPNHTGRGKRISVWGKGSWVTPMGEVPVDEPIANALVEASGGKASLDRLAHLAEHAIEVHLPFLLARNPRVRIVPITLGKMGLEDIEELGEAIAKVVAREPVGSVLVIASTDMTHFESAEVAKEADRSALDAVAQLDPKGLYNTVVENEISMCGFIPTTTALFTAKRLGARNSHLVSYGNSGETSGDFGNVVAYASGWIA